jgi:hypothetical protein
LTARLDAARAALHSRATGEDGGLGVAPDSSIRVAVDGCEVVTYSYGDHDREALFLLNGGPGLPYDCLRDPLLRMVEAGYRLVNPSAYFASLTAFLAEQRG